MKIVRLITIKWGVWQIASVKKMAWIMRTSVPVVKPITIRWILGLVVSRGWELKQLDVSNTFLHGILEEVYMQKLLGYKDGDLLNHVCKLLKSIYDLKQSPRHGSSVSIIFSFLWTSLRVNLTNLFLFLSKMI